MRTSKILTGSIIASCIIIQAFAQEQLGLRLGNYSGINATQFNPAFNVGSPLQWDINLIAAGAFAENNYICIRDANLFKVMRNHAYTRAGVAANTDAPLTNGLQYDFTDSRRRKEAYENGFVTLPSAMFHVKSHTFGIFFNARTVTSTNRVPSSLNYYNVEALKSGDVLHVEPFKTAGMVWSEVGLNYGRNILKKGKHSLHGGVTLKFLQGFEAFYFENHEATDITIHPDYMTYASAKVTFGLASGVKGYGNAAQPYDVKVRGYGAAIDVGAVYISQSKNKEKPYDWKAGASLLDFGKIVFNKNAQEHNVAAENAFNFIEYDYEGVENFNDIFSLASSQSMNDPDASLVNDKFSMWVPAGISVFGEYAFPMNLFINAAAVRRLRFKGHVPERDNIWAITPRYELRWFEVSVPLVLYNDKDLRLGTAFRIGPLVIGTDNITSWFGTHNFSGSDIYFALKLNPTSLGKKTSSGTKKISTRQDCFRF